MDTLFPYTTLVRSHCVSRNFSSIGCAFVFMQEPNAMRVTTPEVSRATGSETHPIPKSISPRTIRSEEHTSELQSLMRISYAVFCLKKKKKNSHIEHRHKTQAQMNGSTTQHRE